LHRHEEKRDPFRLASSKQKREQHAEGRQEDCKREQAAGRRRRDGGGIRRPSASAPSPGGFVPPSGLSVARLVSPNSRNTRATASALAAKATTMPVITIACGTGSDGNPAAAPLRATMPNTRKTPLPITLNARILRSGSGVAMRP